MNQQDLSFPLLYRREAVENATERKIELAPKSASPVKNPRNAEQHHNPVR